MFKYGQKVKHINNDTCWAFVGVDPRDSQRAVLVQRGFSPTTYQLSDLEPIRESKGFIVMGLNTVTNYYRTFITYPVSKETAEESVKNNPTGWTNLQIVEVFG